MNPTGIGMQVQERSAAMLEAAPEDRYIVLFEDDRDEEEGPRVLSRALRLKSAPGRMAADGPVHLVAATALRAKSFGSLGIATVSMSREKAGELAASSGVMKVLRVRSRRLPVTVRRVPEFAAGGGRGPEAAASPAARSKGPLPSDLHAAYLAGARDALDFALGAYRAGPDPAGHGRARPSGPDALGWSLEAIGAGAAARGATGRGVKVAVIDTGLALDHPDFGSRVDPENLRSFVSGQGVEDEDGHGTHCAGVISGPSSSAGGIRYGVAPDAELVVGRVFDDAGRTDDEIVIDAIQWAASRGARVISLSLGSRRRPGEPFSDAYERIASRLLRRERSVLLVAAAGNDSHRAVSRLVPVSDPAACPSILAVAAIDDRHAVADFSNREMDAVGTLDLSGPGVDVHSSTIGGGFEFMSGTSMAAPHVSGVAALVLERNPGMGATALRDALVAGARALGDRLDYGAGLVQVP